VSNAPQYLRDYWDSYRPWRGDGPEPRPEASEFAWTQYPGHGPGAEWLNGPAHALDLGAAECREAAYLAQRGVSVTALDLSPVQVERARRWWAHLAGLTIDCAEATTYLAESDARWDAIYSVWGAAWFTDPEVLLPLVRARLSPGGVFAFAHAEALDGFYGPDYLLPGGFTGPKQVVLRWSYPPQTWADLLKRAGFVGVEATVLEAPTPGHLGTLMVRAHAPADTAAGT
jgi:SAM-dependent methyltransferase